jgi:hypothetical protein
MSSEPCGFPRKTGSQADLRVMVAAALFKPLFHGIVYASA